MRAGHATTQLTWIGLSDLMETHRPVGVIGIAPGELHAYAPQPEVAGAQRTAPRDHAGAPHPYAAGRCSSGAG